MIVLLSGTNRPDSNTRRITSAVEGIYHGLKVPCGVLDLAQLPLEVFSPAAYAQRPASLAPFADRIIQATGLVVITPEYNGGMPGVLKYFIDLLKFPESFCMRPVCFIGLAAGAWGALRPVEHLQQLFAYRNAFVYSERVLLPHVQQLLDQAGRIGNPDIVARLKSQAVGFVDFVERLQGVQLRGAS